MRGGRQGEERRSEDIVVERRRRRWPTCSSTSKTGLPQRMYPGAGRRRWCSISRSAATCRASSASRSASRCRSEQRSAAAQRPRRGRGQSAVQRRPAAAGHRRSRHTFTTREVMVPFKCHVHAWMNALRRRARASVLRRHRRDWTILDAAAAARHLHGRGVAREARHADAADHGRGEGQRRRSTSPSRCPDVKAADAHAAARHRPRPMAVRAQPRRRLRRADQAAPQLPRPGDDDGGVLLWASSSELAADAGHSHDDRHGARRRRRRRRSTRCGRKTPIALMRRTRLRPLPDARMHAAGRPVVRRAARRRSASPSWRSASTCSRRWSRSPRF